MRGYKTNLTQFPILGVGDDFPQPGQPVQLLYETKHNFRQGEKQFERSGHFFVVQAIDHDAMTIALVEAPKVAVLYAMTSQDMPPSSVPPLAHREERSAFGAHIRMIPESGEVVCGGCSATYAERDLTDKPYRCPTCKD